MNKNLHEIVMCDKTQHANFDRVMLNDAHNEYSGNHKSYKSSAIAEMGDRAHNGHRPKRGRGMLCPFRGESWVHV